MKFKQFQLNLNKESIINLVFFISIIISSIFLFLQIFSLYYEHDESMYLLGGIKLSEGKLYTDYMDQKPPLIFFILQFFSRADFYIHRLICLILLIATCFIFYKTLKSIFDEYHSKLAISIFLLLSSSFEVSLLSLRTELFAIFFISISLYFIFIKKENVIGGFFISLLFFLKPTYAILWIPLFFYEKKLLKLIFFFSILIFIFFSLFINVDLIFNAIFTYTLMLRPELSFNSIILLIIELFPFLYFCFFGISLKTNETKTVGIFACLSLVFTLLGLFSFGFYFAAAVPAFFLISSNIANGILKINIKDPLLFVSILILIGLLFFIYHSYYSSLENLHFGIQKAPICIDCLSKNDVKFMKEFSAENPNLIIISPLAPLFYPFFIDKTLSSEFKFFNENSSNGIFPCSIVCITNIKGEKEYWFEKAIVDKEKQNPDYILTSQYKYIPSIGGIPIDNKTMSNLTYGYETYYNGTSILVLKKTS